MAKDEPTYSEAVRAAAAEAAAALGKNLEAVRQRAIGAHRGRNNGKARVPLDVDAQKDKAPPRKPPKVQPADVRTITTLLAETLVANTRAARLEGELTALQSRPAPWWQRWRHANGHNRPRA